MGSTRTVSDLIGFAKRSSVDEFKKELGGDVLVGAPADAPAEDEVTQAATIAPTSTNLRPVADISDHMVWVIKKSGTSLFGRTVVAGRASSSDVWIPHESVSKQHVRLRLRRGGGVLLSDAGSSNGTRVNSAFVSPGEEVELNHRDEVQIGSLSFRYYTAERFHSLLSKMIDPL